MIKVIGIYKLLKREWFIMINERKVLDIIHNPAYSLSEIKEQLSKLPEEFEDIVEYITVVLGDPRFKRRIPKHRALRPGKFKSNHESQDIWSPEKEVRSL